ncbi:MAG: pyridoxamine 5'-phosphate oxidase family protein [Pseudomonadota bacterium]
MKAEQTARASREPYSKMTARPAPDGLGENEAAFIAARDSFYMASVNSDGWPYVQHRGGPRGFLKVLGPTTIGFADYRGNRQYVSVGNIKEDKRVSLFLMDYPNKARLKILGRATVQEAADVPDLAASLAAEGEGRVERVFTIDVDAFDWNCPQFITPRYTTDELADSLAPMVEELEHLRAEVKRLSGVE